MSLADYKAHCPDPTEPEPDELDVCEWCRLEVGRDAMPELPSGKRLCEGCAKGAGWVKCSWCGKWLRKIGAVPEDSEPGQVHWQHVLCHMACAELAGGTECEI